MTLATVFKAADGLVVTADSRATVFSMGQIVHGQQMAIAATYDNTAKILRPANQKFVAAVVHGLGVLGQGQALRTISSYMPEVEALIGDERISVQGFAEQLGNFFNGQLVATQQQVDEPIQFIVCGFNENEPYGRVYTLSVPDALAPVEQLVDQFGLQLGGQHDIVGRMLQGVNIPYQLLALQDAVDLTILLARTTAQVQNFSLDLRGVGGSIDVVVLTRSEGARDVQRKQLRGEQTN